jgi:L-malate glycosyltransferase
MLKQEESKGQIIKSKLFCRVLHVVYRPQRRGAELVAVQLTEALSDRVEGAVCSLFRSNSNVAIEVQYQFNASKGLLTRIFGFNISAVWGLARIIKQFRPQIIIAHQQEILPYVAALKFMHKRGFYFIYQFTNAPPLKSSTRITTHISRILINKAEYIVCCGRICREAFIKYYRISPDKVTSINTSIDQSPFVNMDHTRIRTKMREKLGFRQEEVVLINVGGLSPVKNQTELISLVGGLHQNGIPARLMIVGGGELRESLNLKIKTLGLQNHIQMLGERDDVPSLLAAADLFVLSSRTEAMALVLMEAGLVHLPSVAYNVGGVGDVIEDGRTGSLVPFGDFQRLLEAVSALCMDPARRTAMGEAAYQKCHDSFDIRTISRQYEELFHGLLKT